MGEQQACAGEDVGPVACGLVEVGEPDGEK